MDYFRDMTNLGDDILRSVNRAINQNDYAGLSREIRAQVAGFSDEIKRAAGGSRSTSQRYADGSAFDGGPGYRYAYHGGRYDDGSLKIKLDPLQVSTPFLQKRTGSMAGMGKVVVGGLLMALTGIGAITFSILAMIFGSGFWIGTALFGAASMPAGLLMSRGLNNRELIGKYQRYGQLLGPKEYFSIAELSQMAGESEEITRKNLERMIRKGILPQGRFDRNKTTLMLTSRAYNQYAQAEDARMQRETQESQKAAVYGEMPEDVRAILEEGEAYIDTVHLCNEKIPDASMTQKLNQLEAIVRRIFDNVRKDPDSASDLRKFLSYYLPTTQKLLHAYIDLDNQPEAGKNITQTKKEIEEAVDTINQAFEKLLDQMFQDVAWDISSDISAMKTMMAQDGLREEHNQ